MKRTTHYQVNICGGDFEHVRERFQAWKQETLIYRQQQRMFDGREDVRRLSKQRFDDTERARFALEQACRPQDAYALAAEVDDGERDIWIVMAAYRE
jgi:hypothetical protein